MLTIVKQSLENSIIVKQVSFTFIINVKIDCRDNDSVFCKLKAETLYTVMQGVIIKHLD